MLAFAIMKGIAIVSRGLEDAASAEINELIGAKCKEHDGAVSFDAKKIFHVKNSFAAGECCRESAKAGDRILVKGSRGTQMEKIFECFITSSTR